MAAWADLREDDLVNRGGGMDVAIEVYHVSGSEL